MKKVATSVYLLKNKKILFLVRNKKNDKVHKQEVYLPIGGKVEPAEINIIPAINGGDFTPRS